MKTLHTFPAYDVVDLEQDLIVITAADCDWLSPNQRIFCTEYAARRGDVLFASVTPGNIWDNYERDNRADAIPAALERAKQHGHETHWFNSDATALTSDQRARETWHLLKDGQLIEMRGARFVIRVGHRGAVRLEAAPMPAEPVAEPVEVSRAAAAVVAAYKFDGVAPSSALGQALAANPSASLQFRELVEALDAGPIRLGSLTLERGETRYLMRDERSGQAHSLEISETTPLRLTAHWQGFVIHAQADHDKDILIHLPVNLPNGRRLLDCDKVALLDYLDDLAATDGQPLEGFEFRIYCLPRSLQGPASVWGPTENLMKLPNLADQITAFLAGRPAHRFTVTLPERLNDHDWAAVRAYFAESWAGAPVELTAGPLLTVAGLTPDDPGALQVSSELGRMIMAIDAAHHA